MKKYIQIKAKNIDGNMIYKWHAKDHIEYNRDIVWWLVFILICSISAILSIYFYSKILGILIFLFIPAYYIANNHNTIIYEVIITDKGIHIGDKKILFDNIDNYAIVNSFHNIYELIIVDKEKKEHEVYVNKNDIQMIKDILNIYIKEDTNKKMSLLKYIFYLLKI